MGLEFCDSCVFGSDVFVCYDFHALSRILEMLRMMCVISLILDKKLVIREWVSVGLEISIQILVVFHRSCMIWLIWDRSCLIWMISDRIFVILVFSDMMLVIRDRMLVSLMILSRVFICC